VTAKGIAMMYRLRIRKRHLLTPLDAAAEFFNAVEREVEAPELAAGRLRLQAAMRAHTELERETAARPDSCFAQTALGRVLVAELAVYLGRHAASAIMGKIRYEQPGSEDVLTAIEPSLKGFLGREAAAAVATKIVHLLEPGADTPSTPLPQSG
jgi:hypothetical protein